MMQRENSFLKQKQEQWARERAEKELTNEWFPFGENLRPGGGSPLRKFEPKSPIRHRPKTAPKQATEETVDDEDQQEMINIGGEKNQQKKPARCEDQKLANESHQQNQQVQQQSYHGVPIYPFPYSFYTPTPPDGLAKNDGNQSWPYAIPMPPQFQVIPPNAIPISTINIDSSQICPVSLAEQLAALQSSNVWGVPHAPPGVRYGIPIPPPFVNPSMTSSISSSESGVSGMTSRRDDVEKHNSNDEKQSTSDYHNEKGIP
ncbi:unnamed protein product [Caenorhabditis bovis]|uniref:Uncharacterized protein n=1 Tax=Caenorhabditis bovis TaxID=2654633 RepID=A0A8S1F172_9PELO|nr:unnamed protein product [Caenorhabditis bovis]